MQMIRGMTENFREKCDVIVSHLRAPLNPRIRSLPMILFGRASQAAAVALWSGARASVPGLIELLTWGERGEMRVWGVNMPAFALPPELAVCTAGTDAEDAIPVSLVEAVLLEYPGKKDIVGDPSMRRGAVAAAAQGLELDFVGFEMYVENFAAAQARVA